MVVSLLFSRCSKEDHVNNFGKDTITLNKSGNQIPEFRTFEDLFSAMEQLNLMGEDDRRQYEQANGYKSLLTYVYEIYEGINMDSLQSESDLLNHIAKYPNHITLRQNESGENEYHPYFSDNEFSIVAGANRMLLVENFCYKIFDDGILIVDADNINLIADIDGPYGEDVPPNELIIPGIVPKGDDEPVPLPSCNSNKNVHRNTDGSERTKLKLRCHQMPVSQDQTRVRTFGRIRPYRKIFGIWFHCRRTVSGQITYKVEYLRGITHEIEVNETVNPTLSYSQTRYLNHLNPPNQHASNIHFVSISSHGTTPSTGVASINCSN